MFANLPLIIRYLLTAGIGMVPIIELRGAIPVGVFTFHLSYIESFLCSFIGNIIRCISTSAKRNIIAARVKNLTPGKMIGRIYTIKRNPQLPNIELRLLQSHFVESISSLPSSTFTPIQGNPPGQPDQQTSFGIEKVYINGIKVLDSQTLDPEAIKTSGRAMR